MAWMEGSSSCCNRSAPMSRKSRTQTPLSVEMLRNIMPGGAGERRFSSSGCRVSSPNTALGYTPVSSVFSVRETDSSWPVFLSCRYNKDFLSNTRKAQNTVRQSSKHTISCVKCSGMPGVPFQIYTKFTPFEEKLDVGFKFLAGQKKGVSIVIDTYAPAYSQNFSKYHKCKKIGSWHKKPTPRQKNRYSISSKSVVLLYYSLHLMFLG